MQPDHSQDLSVGVLDLCKIRGPHTAVQAVNDALAVAVHAESIGFVRYWFAEHHTSDVAHSSPEVLVASVAARTRTMRVGTAGNLLRLTQPLRLAKAFGLLSSLHHDRIDLGLARGSAPDAVRARLGHVEPVVENGDREPLYEARVAELLEYLEGSAAVSVSPRPLVPPQVWVLGSQHTSMRIAATRGCSLCLSLFIPLGSERLDVAAALRAYRETFSPAPTLRSPQCAIAVAGVCCERERDAVEVARMHGDSIVPTVVGTPAQCKQAVDRLTYAAGTRNVIFVELSYTLEARLRSLTLLATALGLQPRTASRGTQPRATATGGRPNSDC
jgi:luciferase family oxidoreductase group 1